MVCLILLHIVLLVLVESYLDLWISYYQYFLKVALHYKRKPLESVCLPLWDSLLLLFILFLLFSFIALILSWLANELQITSTAFSSFQMIYIYRKHRPKLTLVFKKAVSGHTFLSHFSQNKTGICLTPDIRSKNTQKCPFQFRYNHV